MLLIVCKRISDDRRPGNSVCLISGCCFISLLSQWCPRRDLFSASHAQAAGSWHQVASSIVLAQAFVRMCCEPVTKLAKQTVGFNPHQNLDRVCCVVLQRLWSWTPHRETKPWCRCTACCESLARSLLNSRHIRIINALSVPSEDRYNG